MKNKLKIFFASIFAIGLVLTGFSKSFADDEFTLEEITVTAQKREENQQKVPIAMETVSGEVMREKGYNNLDQILSSVSSVYINTSPDGMRVSIRGMSDDFIPIGTLFNVSNSTSMIAVNTDGVFSSARGGVGLFDMERVEVLYGPQSTLYSSNSPGGIVNIVTADPKIDKYEISASFKYGNYDTMQMEGMLNVPVSEALAMRLAFLSSSHDGYMADGTSDEERKSLRFKTLFEPTDRFSLLLAAEVTKTGGKGYSGTAAFADQDDLDDPWDNSGIELRGWDPRDRSGDLPKIYARMTWDLGFGDVTLIPMYSDQHTYSPWEDDNFETGYHYIETLDVNREEKGAELRITSSEDFAFDWIIGFNYYEVDEYQELRQYFEDLDIWLNKDRGNWQKSKAAYANVTYPVTDKFRVTGGLRFSDDMNRTLQWSQQLDTDLSITLRDQIAEGTYDNPDYKIGAEYDWRPDSMFYADISTSYRVPGLSLSGPKLVPEELTAYSVGTKNRFFGNRFQLNAAAFYYDYTNYGASAGRITDPLTLSSDDGSNSVGDLTKWGVDVQTTTVIGSNDTLEFSVSYLESEFTKLVFDFVSDALPDLDVSGNPETFSPNWTISATYNKTFDLSNGGSLTASLHSRYKSEFFITYADWAQDSTTYEIYKLEENVSRQEPHHISNFTLSYTNPDGKWTVSGYVNNIENYAVKKNFMMENMMIGDPRTYGVILSMKY